MENLKTPKWFLKKWTAQFWITNWVSFSWLTILPVFQNELTNDSTWITKLSNTQIKLTAWKKYKISMSIYSDWSTWQYYSLYNVTTSTNLSNLWRWVFASLSAWKGLELILTPDVDTIIECRSDSATWTTQYEWKTNIEEIEANLLPIPNILNQMLWVNQNWVDVTASRALWTTYTNTTGKPIEIKVVTYSSVSNASVSLTVDWIVIHRTQKPSWLDTTVTAIIPNNSTYIITWSSGWVLPIWAELR